MTKMVCISDERNNLLLDKKIKKTNMAVTWC